MPFHQFRQTLAIFISSLCLNSPRRFAFERGSATKASKSKQFYCGGQEQFQPERGVSEGWSGAKSN